MGTAVEALADLPESVGVTLIQGLVFFFTLIWLTVLMGAGTYLFVWYRVTLHVTPPWYMTILGDVPLQFLEAIVGRYLPLAVQ